MVALHGDAIRQVEERDNSRREDHDHGDEKGESQVIKHSSKVFGKSRRTDVQTESRN